MTHCFPSVSVIIPVKNDAVRLRLCLNALSKQTYPTDRYEVIVVDNNSTDDVAAAVAEFTDVRLFRETTPGPAAARNTGVAHAKGEVIAFTDADCIPMPEWIQEGVRALENAPIIGGHIDVTPPESRSPTFIEEYSYSTALQQQYLIEQKSFAATANVFVHRDDWETIGPFDTRLMPCEDKEFGLRAQKMHMLTAYAPSAIVAHPIQCSSFGALIHKTASYIQGQVQYWRLQGGHKTTLFAALFQDICPIESFTHGALTHTRPSACDTNYIRDNKLHIALVRLFLVGPIQFCSRLYWVTQGDRVYMTQ